MKNRITDSGLPKTIELSFVAFHGSRNCDKSSALSVYDSYIRRKRQIIKKKVHALKKGDRVNVRKLRKEMYYLKNVKRLKNQVIQFLEDELLTTCREKKDLLKEAEDLLNNKK